MAEHLSPESEGVNVRTQPGRWDIERELQRRIWDGGFAGICFPAAYGGLGLSRQHQLAFTEESLPYDMPYSLNVPTFGILAATLIDYGTPEQQARYLPKILMGEELWVQFLSEPSGGSDLAGCLTRADRDGDVWIMNGSKIWSSGAADARLRDVPGPHELGRPEAPWPHDVHHADPPARRDRGADPPGRRVDGVLPGVLRRRAHPRRERDR